MIVPYAPRGNAARDAPRSKGAGGSRSRAAGELTLGLLSGEERAVYLGFYCGSWPVGSPHRSDGGLTADQSPADVHRTLWELACQRWRPASRPISCRCTPNPVGAGLPAMAAHQPTNLIQMYTEPVGAGLPAMAPCQPTNLLQMYKTYCGCELAPTGISGVANVSAVRRYPASGSPPARPASQSAESPLPCVGAGLPDSRRSHWP